MTQHQRSFAGYHDVPQGWDVASVLATHKELAGAFDLHSRLAPERYPELLRYRSALYAIAEGVRSGDAACVELAVRYIELQHMGFYSGYVRALLARRLKHVPLSDDQRLRLSSHYLKLLRSRSHFSELRHHLGLWRSFISPPDLASVEQLLSQRQPSRFCSGVLAKLTSSSQESARRCEEINSQPNGLNTWEERQNMAI